MTIVSRAWTRALVRGLLWFLLGLIGLGVALVAGPISPELAAWFSSRHKR